MATFKDKFFSSFHIITFVVLQIIALICISRSMNYTRFALAEISTSITAPIYATWSGVWRPFTLVDENQALINQNIALLNQSKNLFCSVGDTMTYVNDTTPEAKKLYAYNSAQVIYNSTDRKRNYIIIDKGEMDSVRTDIAVLSPSGIIGVVTHTTQNFATVMPLLHPSSRVSAHIMPANQIGTMVWKEGTKNTGILQDIPQHAIINVGDSVFTSGYSAVFPKNILIGTVTSATNNPKNTFLDIEILFATDFSNLNHVYLVHNLFHEEIDSLKIHFDHE